MAKRGKSSYAVGFKRPPRHTQFKPGKSGNPKGRPRGSKNLAAVVKRELAARIDVTENGTRKRITKERAIAKQIVNKAVSGDPKAIPILLKAAASGEDDSGTDTFQRVLGGPEDELVMASIVRRIRQLDEPPGAPPDDPPQDPTQSQTPFNP